MHPLLRERVQGFTQRGEWRVRKMTLAGHVAKTPMRRRADFRIREGCQGAQRMVRIRQDGRSAGVHERRAGANVYICHGREARAERESPGVQTDNLILSALAFRPSTCPATFSATSSCIKASPAPHSASTTFRRRPGRFLWNVLSTDICRCVSRRQVRSPVPPPACLRLLFAIGSGFGEDLFTLREV